MNKQLLLLPLVLASASAFPAQSDKSWLRQQYESCGDRTEDHELRACLKPLMAEGSAAKVNNQALPANPAGEGKKADTPEVEPKKLERPGKNFLAQWGEAGDPYHCLGGLCAYRPSYAIFRNTNDPNAWPSSPAAGHMVTSPISSQPTELKFQLSFKTLWAELGQWQIWTAYTQQSHWQILNGALSRPFRETNYEPEIYVNYLYPLGTGSPLKMLGLGLVHQSNGQSNPLSRSWNRVYLQGGLTLSDDLSLLLKAWHRFKEDPAEDDNPGIQDYIGRAEATFNWAPWEDKRWQTAVRLRHSLNPHSAHGSAQVELSFPVFQPRMRGFLQLFRGYGETMLDYNHLQTSFGLGVGILNW